MSKRNLLCKFCAGVIVCISISANAAVVSTDWQNLGDNLITHDTVSGFDWLDLTETNTLSFNQVSGQLGAGDQFQGFRYATESEVVALWANFAVNLAAGAPTSFAGPDSGVQGAASTLGNIFPEFSTFSFLAGASGIIGEASSPTSNWVLGAAITTPPSVQTTYYSKGQLDADNATGLTYVGSYLVRPAVVPLPAAVWLFGSGLLGLIGLARRRKA